jgi:hypothetical protein
MISIHRIQFQILLKLTRSYCCFCYWWCCWCCFCCCCCCLKIIIPDMRIPGSKIREMWTFCSTRRCSPLPRRDPSIYWIIIAENSKVPSVLYNWRFWIRMKNECQNLQEIEMRSRLWRMASSVMSCRVALVRTDVSEELSPSIIRVTRIGELGTTLAVTSNWRTLRRNVGSYKNHTA